MHIYLHKPITTEAQTNLIRSILSDGDSCYIKNQLKVIFTRGDTCNKKNIAKKYSLSFLKKTHDKFQPILTQSILREKEFKVQNRIFVQENFIMKKRIRCNIKRLHRYKEVLTAV